MKNNNSKIFENRFHINTESFKEVYDFLKDFKLYTIYAREIGSDEYSYHMFASNDIDTVKREIENNLYELSMTTNREIVFRKYGKTDKVVDDMLSYKKAFYIGGKYYVFEGFNQNIAIIPYNDPAMYAQIAKVVSLNEKYVIATYAHGFTKATREAKSLYMLKKIQYAN